MLTTVAVLVLMGLPSPQFTWTVTSPGGAATLAQTALPDDACSLRCELAGKPAWAQQACLGRGTDFIFVSDDCATLFVLNEYPLRAARTELTVIGAIATAKGTPPVFALRPVRLEEVVDHRRLRGEGRRVRWLAGAVGEPGVKPHLNAAGTAVEFSLVDGSSRTVPFSKPEDLLARAAAVTGPQPGARDDGMYQYVGDDGSTQFVTGLAQVPARYRKRATLVESEISTVKGEQTQYRPWLSSGPSIMDPVRTDPAPPKPAPTTSSPRSDCVFGLNGAACDAVRNAGRGNNGGLAPRSPSPWGR